MLSEVRQRGAALIVTLVLIAVALVLGLSSYQTSRLEESMAGNYRAASRAQMAADYAAAAAWSNEFRGSTTVASTAIDTLTPVSLSGTSDNSNFSASDLRAYYLVTPVQEGGNDKFGRYDVVAIGEVSQDPPVYRYVQFLARLALGPGSAMVAAGENDDSNCEDSVELISATSGAFGVEGEEEVFGSLKAAVQVACSNAMTEFANDITGDDTDDYVVSGDSPEIATCTESTGNNNLCNYVGGIQGGIDIDIFQNPEKMAQFISALKERQEDLEDIDGDGVGQLVNLDSENYPGDDDGKVPYNVFHNLLDADGANGITYVTSTPYKGGEEVWVDSSGNDIRFTDGADNNTGNLIGVVGEGGAAVSVGGATSEQIAEAKAAAISSELSIGTFGLSNKQETLREGSIGCGVLGGASGAMSTLPCEAQGGDQPRVDYTFPGNITGSGVLIIDGNADFNGVPAFEGLIIVLGDYAVTGGGGGEFNGSIVSAPIVSKDISTADDAPDAPDPVDPRFYIPGMGDVSGKPEYWIGNTLSCYRDATVDCGFDKKIFQFTGGGSAYYNYDLDNLEQATAMLNGALGAFYPVTVDGETKYLKPSDLLAYGSGEEALYYYALNYRQSFEEPPLLADKIGDPPWDQYVGGGSP